MAGFTKMYCIGEEGGFQGCDGMNRIFLQILIGHGNRMWLEAVYFDSTTKPLGKVKRIVPEDPEDPDILLDACIAFYPEAFKKCPSLERAEKSLGRKEFWDFNVNGIPSIWKQLRKEAAEYFKQLIIYEAFLYKMNLD
ncbi:MAG: hypothetical protein JNL74_20030 [Fibrobacteres bacterium]|nr:hypothetical protein [Fibrobacterota bacterium]